MNKRETGMDEAARGVKRDRDRDMAKPWPQFSRGSFY